MCLLMWYRVWRGAGNEMTLAWQGSAEPSLTVTVHAQIEMRPRLKRLLVVTLDAVRSRPACELQAFVAR